MAKKKLSKKEASDSVVETVEHAPTLPLSLSPTGFTPSVDPFPHQDALAELRSEVLTMTQGKDPADVVWQFEMTGGRKGGTSVQFYSDCKTHEIKTGTPCQYLRPVSAPVNIPASGGMASIGAPKMRAAKKCANCSK